MALIGNVSGSQDHDFTLGMTGTVVLGRPPLGAHLPNITSNPEVNFFVSGAVGAKGGSAHPELVYGVSVFGGDTVTSGTAYAGKVQVGDSNMGFPPSTALNVYANVSSDFAAKIDNDQSSAGHILKLITDGNGSGTTMLEMEDGDGDTLFKARADGRFGFGTSGVSGMGAGTFVVGIDGGHTADIAISKRLQHLGDSNTFMDFPAVDQINFQAGGVEMLSMLESSDAGRVLILSGGAGTEFNVQDSNDVNFFVSGAIGARGGSEKGSACFGGDVQMSGTLHLTGSGGLDNSRVCTIVGSGGHPITGAPATVSNNSNGVTITAAQIVQTNGIFAMNRGSSKTDTSDTAANIIASIPGCVPGLQVDFTYFNLSSNTVTFAGGTGVVMLNTSGATFDIAAGKGRRFHFAINSNMSSITMLPMGAAFDLNS